MNDKKAESELKTLYQITGNAADINTILINRGEFRNLRARVAELEAQLESIGAGGIGPLMPGKPADCIPRNFNTWSPNEGDTWYEHPADAQIIEDVFGGDMPVVGGEYEVIAGWCGVKARYRITSVSEDGDCEVECISHQQAAAAPQPPDQDGWQKLDKPARVGGGTFGIGTSAQHVVLAAQRAHEEHVRIGALTHEQIVEEERRRRQLWDMIHGQVDAATQLPEVEQKPVAEVIESHVRPGLDGRYTAEVAGCERLSVGAELFVHPQPRQPLTDEQVAVAFGWKMGCLPLPYELHVARAIERAHGIVEEPPCQ